MIKLKPLLEIQLIKEALPLSTAREYTSIKRNPSIIQRMDSILDSIKQRPDVKTSKRGDRVYIPFKSDQLSKSFDAQLSREFTDFYTRLSKYTNETRQNAQMSSDLNVKLDTYSLPIGDAVLAGALYDQYGRQVKMSKFIQTVVTETKVKYPLALLKKYAKTVKRDGKEGYIQGDGKTFVPWDDVITKFKKAAAEEINFLIKLYESTDEVKSLRQGNPEKKYYIVFSKHAYDVAGMSTHRGWTSCMNLYGGSNSHFIQDDVLQGTIVAYLINEKDLNISRPIARISIKPFVNIENPDEVIYQPEHRVYGTAPGDFLPYVIELVDELQPNKVGTFQLIDTLYCDSNRMVTKLGNDPEIAEIIRELMNKQLPMRTVDEAKYILQRYTDVYGGLDQAAEVKFEDTDALFVSGDINIRFNVPMSYCPIRFGTINSLAIDSPTTFKNFPREVTYQLDIDNLKTSNLNFSGLFTKIPSLYIRNSHINSFKGLQPSVSTIAILNTADGISEINSFEGIPGSVSSLLLDRHVKLNMTVQDMVRQLKPSALHNLRLPVTEFHDIDRPKFKTPFTESFGELMFSTEFDTSPEGDSLNRRYWAVLLAIANELKLKSINGTPAESFKHLVTKLKIT